MDNGENRQNDFVIHQYTGLKDKNEVEIYEGDIIEEHFGAYGKVTYKKGCFVVELIEDVLLSKLVLADFGNEVEIIGNIYENKELIDVDI